MTARAHQKCVCEHTGMDHYFPGEACARVNCECGKFEPSEGTNDD